MTHLYEVEHPYYCDGGDEENFESWQELKETILDCDRDLNLVVRWDWHPPEPEEEEYYPERLEVSVLLQRKGYTVTWRCPISKGDEDDVRAVMTDMGRYLLTLWTPLELHS